MSIAISHSVVGVKVYFKRKITERNFLFEVKKEEELKENSKRIALQCNKRIKRCFWKKLGTLNMSACFYYFNYSFCETSSKYDLYDYLKHMQEGTCFKFVTIINTFSCDFSRFTEIFANKLFWRLPLFTPNVICK